ncbi:hypothetical protein P7K49_035737 [Saguinus oedipus]|uniref:Uncharacterized protein n=1 Tax=Saguinus oedipus TaxID=9490 RepID=A0ABQ9TNG1_SAGOE|nr:hypothetical protein P7K49_035737 [Saguinus oedipus]
MVAACAHRGACSRGFEPGVAPKEGIGSRGPSPSPGAPGRIECAPPGPLLSPRPLRPRPDSLSAAGLHPPGLCHKLRTEASCLPGCAEPQSLLPSIYHHVSGFKPVLPPGRPAPSAEPGT